MMSSFNETVLIGKVSTTHGVKGQLRVSPYSGDVDSLLAFRSIMVKTPGGEMETFTVEASKAHGKKVIITLKEFDNINQVLHLVGREVYALHDQLPVLSEDEYYWCELLGMQVVTDEGESLGELIDIIVTGSNDVYVVKGEGGELLIPALEDVVLDVDPAAKLMTVSLPEGLRDL
jgi:16S rRNA processing protein RimM